MVKKNKYFYESHCHVFNLSHPNLLLFIRRFFSINIENPLILFLLIIIALFISPLLILILVAILLLIKRYPLEQILPRIIGVRHLYKHIFNLLSVMENNLGDYLKLMEDDINKIINKNDNILEDIRYNKFILTPLMMDFGNKWINKFSYIYYNKLSTKPISDQVIDLFNGIREYKQNSKYDILEIYPFLGINTQNYYDSKETAVEISNDKVDFEEYKNKIKADISYIKLRKDLTKLVFIGKMTEYQRDELKILFKNTDDKNQIDKLFELSQNIGIPEKMDYIEFKKKILNKLTGDEKKIVLSFYNKIDSHYVLKEKITKDNMNKLLKILEDINFTRNTLEKLLNKYFEKFNKDIFPYKIDINYFNGNISTRLDVMEKKYVLDRYSKRKKEYVFKNNITEKEKQKIKIIFDSINFNDRYYKLNIKMGTFNGDLNSRKTDYNYFFSGIKVYPSLGFDPWPEDDIENKKVADLYNLCNKKNIPITTHGSDGGFLVIDKKSGIEYTFYKWQTVLKRYPNLKINFAHFGGFKMKWAKFVFRLMIDYPNVYTDFSCHCNKMKDYKKLFEIINKLCKNNSDQKEKLLKRIMFGSDFMINLLGKSNSYVEYITNFFKAENVDAYLKNAFCNENPYKFLFY